MFVKFVRWMLFLLVDLCNKGLHTINNALEAHKQDKQNIYVLIW